MDFGDYLLFIVGAILVNNILLAKFLGHCPFIGVSKKMDTATGMSMAVIFVITVAGVVTWIVNTYILVPFEIEYLRTISFILVIASLVQLVEIVMQKTMPALYRALGIFLPLITTNCAVLGVAIFNIQKEHDFFDSLIFSFASALGYALALILFAGIRERFAWPMCRAPLKAPPWAWSPQVFWPWPLPDSRDWSRGRARGFPNPRRCALRRMT
jgi:electron transport complex protein RnfA